MNKYILLCAKKSFTDNILNNILSEIVMLLMFGVNYTPERPFSLLELLLTNC